jgi:hypothetical protein
MTTPPLRPFHDVWLKPRRVFRELASTPIGGIDYLLAAAQGTVNWLALARGESLGKSNSVLQIISTALAFGSIAGVLSFFLMAEVYRRLARSLGGEATRAQVFHVLAYSGIPMVVSLGAWLLTASLVGEPAFLETPSPDLDRFVVLLLEAQFAAHVALVLWSGLLQIMGLSEIEHISVPRAFGLCLFGQLLVAFLAVVLALLLEGGQPG